MREHHLPEELTLRPSKVKLILYAFIGLLFLIAGVFMFKDGDLKGLFVIIFFGLGLILFLVQLIPNASQLKLTKEGFIVTSFFKSRFTKWSDIKCFEEGYAGSRKLVVFDYVQSHTKYSFGKNVSKLLAGRHNALPDTYGLKISELVKLMNEWKTRNDILH